MKFILAKQGSPYPNYIDYDLDILWRLTGLHASAGFAICPWKSEKERGAVFVDGRYKLAAENIIDKSNFDICDYDELIYWILNNIDAKNDVVWFDPKYFTLHEFATFRNKLPQYKFEAIDYYDLLNVDHKTKILNLYKMPNDRMQLFHNWLSKQDIDAYLICDPCYVSWILGLRDLNNGCTKSILGYLLCEKNGNQTLYIDNQYKDSNYKKTTAIIEDLKKYRRVGTDYRYTPQCFNLDNVMDLSVSVNLYIKNQSEIDEIVRIAKLDSIAITKTLQLAKVTKNLSEFDVVEELENFRRESDDYIGISFDTISAADENSAIIHYSPTEKTNKKIKNILLLDCGGQYKHGTTDITRTIAIGTPSNQMKLFYTLVLKGHINLANATFPVGITGEQLDTLARQFLWKHNCDYAHGTGHGIGYLLNVHEGDVNISPRCNKPILPGLVISNEPGIYFKGAFGIRLENMLIAKQISDNFMQFDVISLVPFDEILIDFNILTESEKIWLSVYNRKVQENCIVSF